MINSYKCSHSGCKKKVSHFFDKKPYCQNHWTKLWAETLNDNDLPVKLRALREQNSFVD